MRPPGSGLKLDKANASYYGKRGAVSKTALRESPYCIEGETVTPTQIAERLGVKRSIATDRIRLALKRGHALTWAVLGLKKEQ